MKQRGTGANGRAWQAWRPERMTSQSPAARVAPRISFEFCPGTTVPKWMFKAYGNAEDDASHDLLSTAIATEQCDELLSEGVEGLHFYTLNKSELVFQVCRALGVEPEPVQIAAGCG